MRNGLRSSKVKQSAKQAICLCLFLQINPTPKNGLERAEEKSKVEKAEIHYEPVLRDEKWQEKGREGRRKQSRTLKGGCSLKSRSQNDAEK